MNVLRMTVLTGILLATSGCFLQKKPKIAIPVAAPPPAPAASPAPEPEPAPAPVAATPAPQPAAPPAAPPAPAPKPSPFPPAAGTPAPARPAPAQPITPPPTPAPALGAILSTDQRRQLDAAYQSDLRQANAALNGLNGRTLTPDQTDSVNRARAFIRQAAQYHDRDLTTAAELARRARVLTQDLAGAHK